MSRQVQQSTHSSETITHFTIKTSRHIYLNVLSHHKLSSVQCFPRKRILDVASLSSDSRGKRRYRGVPITVSPRPTPEYRQQRGRCTMSTRRNHRIAIAGIPYKVPTPRGRTCGRSIHTENPSQPHRPGGHRSTHIYIF